MVDLYHRLEGPDEAAALLAGASDEEVLLRLDGKPALLRLPGRDAARPARWISALLHGNEDSGYRALLALLREPPDLPFTLWAFIGNVRAASTDGWFAHRYLDDQEDFNRVWGREPQTTRQRRCAAAVLGEVTAAPLEAAVDLHNNTGANPQYAILPRRTPPTFTLAATCADIGLVWATQDHTLMDVMADHGAAIAVECGQAGIPEHTEYAATAIKRFLAEEDFDGAERRPRDLFEIRYRVEVRPEVKFAFAGPLDDDLDLVLRPGLDGRNFGMLLAGTEIGRMSPDAAMPLTVTGRHGEDATERFFRCLPDGRLVTTEDITPVMLTSTVRQIRRDCLFYVARRWA